MPSRRIVDDAKRWAVRFLAYIVLLFMLAPLAVVVMSSFTAGQTSRFPPEGLSFRWIGIALARSEFLYGLQHSAVLALVSTLFSVVLGYIAALVITRNATGARLVSVIALGPLFVSSAVLGLAFLIILSKVGLLGSATGLLLAYVLIALPFTTRMIAGVLLGIGLSEELAARVYGANRFRAVMHVTVPLSGPGVFTAGVYAFVHIFDESVIINFIGSVRYDTFPRVLIARLSEVQDPVASVYATFIILATVGLVLIASRLFGLDRLSQSMSGTSVRG